jgi:hypothetical protein
LRDRYYDKIFSYWKKSVESNGVIAGVNFLTKYYFETESYNP